MTSVLFRADSALRTHILAMLNTRQLNKVNFVQISFTNTELLSAFKGPVRNLKVPEVMLEQFLADAALKLAVFGVVNMVKESSTVDQLPTSWGDSCLLKRVIWP